MNDWGKNRITPGAQATLPAFFLQSAGFLLLLILLHSSIALAQSPGRMAIVNLVGDVDGQISSRLRQSARNTSGLELLDEELVRYAVEGTRYEGNLNFSREQARALGMSIGCDFYLLGKVQHSRRLSAGDEFYFESLAGLFMVETRSGRLIHFSFERKIGQSAEEALAALKRALLDREPDLWQRIRTARKKHLTEIENVASRAEIAVEILPDSALSSLPVFYQRLKPAYTEQAELARITATVELEADFGEDGRVGRVEVVKWAGFGLDEAAQETLGQLRFKPAEQNGKLVTIRGLVRYNFGRWSQSQAAPTKAAPGIVEGPLHKAPTQGSKQGSKQEDIERLKQTLRSILNAGKLPGKNPELQEPE